MFSLKRAKKELSAIELNGEARLSDMFVLMYVLHLAKKLKVAFDRYAIQKALVEVLEKLESDKKRQSLLVFNLPFYRGPYGHYNEAITSQYIKTLVNSGLVEPENDKKTSAYRLTGSADDLVSSFEKQEEGSSENLRYLKGVLTSYITSVKEKPRGILRFLHQKKRSHDCQVLDLNGSKVKVDDLTLEPTVAIAYNADDFESGGKRSDVVPEEYLTELASIIQDSENQKEFSKEEVESAFTALLKNEKGHSRT